MADGWKQGNEKHEQSDVIAYLESLGMTSDDGENWTDEATDENGTWRFKSRPVFDHTQGSWKSVTSCTQIR